MAQNHELVGLASLLICPIGKIVLLLKIWQREEVMLTKSANNYNICDGGQQWIKVLNMNFQMSAHRCPCESDISTNLELSRRSIATALIFASTNLNVDLHH
jgi:hypothetical protein